MFSIIKKYDIIRNNIIVIVLCAMTFGISAQSNHTDYTLNSLIPPDSISNKDADSYVRDLIIPGTLVAVGTVGVWSIPFWDLNNKVQNGMASLRGNHYFKIDDVVQYIPVSAYIAMGAFGVKCKHPFRERFMAGTTAAIALGIIVNSVKYTVREKRPDANTRNSYPSGHTATVFMGAELIRQEYGLGLSIAAYTAAVGVGFLRMYNNRHWLNDVIGGAGVGILCARIGYWMLPLYRKWFHWDKTGTATAIMPSFNTTDRSLGINFTANF